jgi:hypothetical protein
MAEKMTREMKLGSTVSFGTLSEEQLAGMLTALKE